MKILCLILLFSHFSTLKGRKENHFPRLTYLDISYNSLDCNCTLEQLFSTRSTIAKNLRNIVNITCHEKEIIYKEKSSSSSYYINFVGPSGRFDRELEVIITFWTVLC